MSDKRILLLFTNHRVAEKLWPIIPKLAEFSKVDLFLVGLFSNQTPWIGDIDERQVVIQRYTPFINNIIFGPGVKFHGDNISDDLSKYVDLDSYDLVIFDDNREMREFNIPNFYEKCKSKGITVVGNPHGDEQFKKSGIGKSFDVRMVFGEKEQVLAPGSLTGGIPANDTLKGVKRNQKHILIITNVLGYRPSVVELPFDKNFAHKCGAIELSKEYNLPIVVKIKTRLDDTDYIKGVQYVKGLLDCDVVANTDNIDQLIADSAFVISYPSTLAFKPIQLGIPTILIKKAQLSDGNFHDYPGLVDLDTQLIFDNLQMQFEHGKFTQFIKQTIAGGDTFTSTDRYIDNIKGLL
tara:strand:- start:6022 stop:7074 length:1053 start_codon:yes stop_codon:yes gene_type:complete